MSTLNTYITGYALSVAMTLAAFGLYQWHVATVPVLAFAFILLALLQLAVQLYFFLHVGRGQNRHWNAVALVFTLFAVCILVGGTLWIMQNLQHHRVSGNPYIDNQITAQNEND